MVILASGLLTGSAEAVRLCQSSATPSASSCFLLPSLSPSLLFFFAVLVSISQGRKTGPLSIGRVLEHLLCWAMRRISGSREGHSGLTPQPLDAGTSPEVRWHFHALDEAKELPGGAQSETRAWLILFCCCILCSVLLTAE